MDEKQKKKLIYLVYTLIVVLIFGFLFWFGHFAAFQDFINKIENSSFDLRQSLISKYKKPDKNLVILAVDDASYEYIMDKYGSWPISRKTWSEVIDSLEDAKAKYIVFDMLFLKPNLNDVESDKLLIESVKNNKNVFLSMNFDNYPSEVRMPKTLNKEIQLKIKKGELEDNEFITFINSRTVMKELSDVTKNIALINVTRDKDGVIRNATPIFKYKNNYYPNLSLAVALNLLEKDSVSIEKNSIVIDDEHKIPLDRTNRAILNWYGKGKTYAHIPLWHVLNAIKEKDSAFLAENFENKIVYIGTTATSLSDIKSVPTESNLAGVELHTTFINNILDNNFIKKIDFKIDFLIALVLCLIVGYFVLKIESVLKTVVFLFGVLIAYGLIALYAMQFFNIWLNVVIPYISMIATFVLVYCEKYLLKVRDYEQTYKLATEDGLTGLYNHRYFQEQMIVNINNFKRYGTVFSLILIDIDFFKKFNDTYGHQSGDCVLKQVAAILKKNSRSSDVVCRYGGEEMTIILTNTNKQDAIATAKKICEAVRNTPFILANGEKVNVTISLGVATVGINGEKPQEMIEYSDKCLYKAKESGRNQAVFEI